MANQITKCYYMFIMITIRFQNQKFKMVAIAQMIPYARLHYSSL